MQLGRASAFGLGAVLLLAEQPAGHVVSAEDIAETTGIPIDYLRKILQRLARGKVVASGRGRGGGFCLAQRADQITLLDIVEAIEGPIGEESLLGYGPGTLVDSHVEQMLQQCRQHVNVHLRQMLGELSVKDLLSSPAPVQTQTLMAVAATA